MCTQSAAGNILLPPGGRADVVAAIPPGEAMGSVLTLWTRDYSRTGGGFSNRPTVPVMHLSITGTAGATFTIAAGTALRASTGDVVETIGAATGALLNPAAFVPAKLGLATQNIQIQTGGGMATIDG